MITHMLSQCTFWCSVLSDCKASTSGCCADAVSMHLLVLSAFRPLILRGNSSLRTSVSMHLLVLSAFRLSILLLLRVFTWKSQCTFWCSVLSDVFLPCSNVGMYNMSQCTFWCSVLSDRSFRSPRRPTSTTCLNAPSGAQCFPTGDAEQGVSRGNRSQCTFWCSVLSDRATPRPGPSRSGSLNAPSGAQCFPTLTRDEAQTTIDTCLNAPSGAQCFPTPPPENRATTPFTGTKSPPTWKAPHRIGSHLSN